LSPRTPPWHHEQALQQPILAQFHSTCLRASSRSLAHQLQPCGLAEAFQLTLAGGNLTFQLFFCRSASCSRSYSSGLILENWESWRFKVAQDRAPGCWSYGAQLEASLICAPRGAGSGLLASSPAMSFEGSCVVLLLVERFHPLRSEGIRLHGPWSVSRGTLVGLGAAADQARRSAC